MTGKLNILNPQKVPPHRVRSVDNSILVIRPGWGVNTYLHAVQLSHGLTYVIYMPEAVHEDAELVRAPHRSVYTHAILSFVERLQLRAQ